MAIEILVKPEIDEASLDKSAAELEATFKAASARTGRQIQDNLSDALTKASVTAVNAAGAVSTAEAKLTDVRQKAETQAKAVAKAEESLTRLRQTPLLTEAIAAAESRLAAERDKHTGILARLTAAEEAAAMVGAGASLVPLVGIADAAAGSLALLPGLLLATGSAFGVLKLSTSGVGAALGDLSDPTKLATDLQGLAPAARQFVLSVQTIMPALEGLKTQAQNSFFAGLGPQILQIANVYLPSLRAAIGGIADAFNKALSGAAQQLLNPATAGALKSTFDNISSAFHNLAPALAPVVSAFSRIAEVSTGFLPGLAQAATNAANAFSGFIDNASKTGELKHWIQDGIDTMHTLGGAAVTVGKSIAELEPIGKQALPAITSLANDVASAVHGIKTGVDDVSSVFHWLETAAQDAANVIDPLLEKIQTGIGWITNPAGSIAHAFGMGPDPLRSVTNPAGPAYSGGGGSFGGEGNPSALGSGQYRTRDGQIRNIPNATANLPAAPAGGYTVPAVPDAATKTSSADKLPAGTKTDPVYTAPSTSLATGSQPNASSNPWDSYDPLQQAASGGFSLPNIARMGTTFLAELALGNPLGRLQAQKKSQELGSSASNPMYTSDVAWSPALAQAQAQAGSVSTAGLSGKDAVAADIINAAAARGLNKEQTLAALSTGILESGLGSNAMTNVPQNQGGTVVQGVFQQDSSYNKYGGRTDPRNAAAGYVDQFIARGGQNMDPYAGAVKVQVGQYGPDYVRSFRPQAEQYYNRLNGAQGLLNDPSLDPGGVSNRPGWAHPQMATGYDPNSPTGGGNVNPNFAIDTSTSQAYGPPTGRDKRFGGGSALAAPGIVGGTPHQGTGAPPGPSSAGQAQAPKAGTGAGAGVSGGILGTAEAAAATALNGIAPGAGAAAQVVTQEANRFAGYLGQLGGIAASGILETFQLHGSGMTASGGLPGKIVGGLAGAHPVTPNAAANTQSAQKPNDKGGQANEKNNGNGQNGPLVVNNVENQHFHNTDSGQVASEQNRQILQATAANPL